MIVFSPLVRAIVAIWGSESAPSRAVVVVVAAIVAGGALWKVFHSVRHVLWFFLGGLIVSMVLMAMDMTSPTAFRVFASASRQARDVHAPAGGSGLVELRDPHRDRHRLRHGAGAPMFARRIERPAYRAALARESRYFNAHPYLAGVAVGALTRAELDGVDPARIERFRTALAGPLGSVGDRLVWASWLPFCSLVALCVFGAGGSPAGGGRYISVAVQPRTLLAQGMGTSGWSVARPQRRLGAWQSGSAAGAAVHRERGGARRRPRAAARASARRRAGQSAGRRHHRCGVAGDSSLARLRERAEGWRIALGVLAIFVLYSVPDLMPEREAKIVNKLGIHARPAAEIVKTAGKFKSNITIVRDDLEVNAKEHHGRDDAGRGVRVDDRPARDRRRCRRRARRAAQP